VSPEDVSSASPALPPPRVALMQPTFMPWQGYFGLIAAADCFVFLDDLQFCRRSFDHRNRLLQTDGSEYWVTVPVAHTGSEDRGRFNAVVPQVDARFRKKLLLTLRSSYARTAFFADVFPSVEAWINTDWKSLAVLNIDFIKRVTAMLGYAADFRLSSEMSIEGKRSALLASVLRQVGAKTYLSAKGSFGYMRDDRVFPVPGITTVFQDFVPPAYPQLQSDSFVSHLSVLDALFQVGPVRTRTLISEGQQPFRSWNDMNTADGPSDSR
jgi:hypothetical protein